MIAESEIDGKPLTASKRVLQKEQEKIKEKATAGRRENTPDDRARVTRRRSAGRDQSTAHHAALYMRLHHTAAHTMHANMKGC